MCSLVSSVHITLFHIHVERLRIHTYNLRLFCHLLNAHVYAYIYVHML